MTEKDHFNELNNKIAYLKNILFNIPGCVFWKNVSGTYQGCNRVFLEMVGLDSEEEVVGKTDNDFYWKNQASDLRKNDLLVIESGQTKIFEEEAYLMNGEKKLYSVVKTPLYDSSGRNVVGVVGTSVDVNRNLVLEHILVNLPGHVYWKDKTGVYLGCNDRQANSLGLVFGKQVIGKTDFELLWGREAAEKFRENDLKVIKTGTHLIIEEPAIANGYPATVLSQKVPLRDRSGNIVGVLGISVDITKLKETQADLQIALDKAKASDKAKTEFLENMRHDLRTPLTGIVGCAQLMQMQADDPKIVEYSNDLVESSNALLELLNKVLESVAVTSGEIPLLKKQFSLKEVLEQIVRLNQSLAVVKGLKLSLDYGDGIPALIGDPVRVQRVILELVTNALKYTDEGEVRVSARLIGSKERELTIELRISDTGMGIHGDKHHEIYTKFTRLIPSYKGTYPGTGLGLSVVKQLIEDLNGEIHLESDVGKGAMFICLIPFQQSLLTDEIKEKESTLFKESRILSNKKVKDELAPSSPETTTAISHGSRVLVVEDNTIAAKMAKDILLNLNCHVDIAQDGKTALEKVEINPYDLILIDVGLPDMNGYEVSRHIRLDERKQNASVPIIGLTAHIQAEEKQRCFANGMNVVLTKPLTPEKASEVLNTFI